MRIQPGTKFTVCNRLKNSRNALVLSGRSKTELFLSFLDDVFWYCNSSIEVWEKAQRRHPGKQIIHICDNARYYKCREIKEWLDKNPRTQVKFLPPYAPNLNLIERLWKFLRKEVINSNYYAKFSEFKTAVLGFFDNIKQYKSALETLLTLRFHLPKME